MMNTQLMLCSAVMLFGVFISSAAQVMLKIAAQKQYDSFWREYLNPLVIAAYVIFLGAALLSVYGYKAVPLTLGSILSAAGYIFVTVFGVVIFKEKLNREKVVALIMILSGIAVYSLLG